MKIPNATASLVIPASILSRAPSTTPSESLHYILNILVYTAPRKTHETVSRYTEPLHPHTFSMLSVHMATLRYVPLPDVSHTTH